MSPTAATGTSSVAPDVLTAARGHKSRAALRFDRAACGYPIAVDSAWTAFLQTPPVSGHAVQIYSTLDELSASVSAYLGAGFGAGQPAILVATPEHRAAFAKRLRTMGWDARVLEADRMLTVLDAEQTLETLMGRDGPSAIAFEQIVGNVIDEVTRSHPGAEVRAYGEMVDILARRGMVDDAIALEELWNRVAETRRFSLLCAYELDVFDVATQQAPMPHVCRVHSHVLPAPDGERLEAAVESALEEVLGRTQTGRVYTMVANEASADHAPLAQRVLMWVSAHMPASAERVLASSRTHYATPA